MKGETDSRLIVSEGVGMGSDSDSAMTSLDRDVTGKGPMEIGRIEHNDDTCSSLGAVSAHDSHENVAEKVNGRRHHITGGGKAKM